MEAVQAGEINAFLGGETSFEGKLTYTGAVRFDGRFKGEIHTEDILVVGETAKVEGQIHVGTAIVKGEVIGDITATERVELHHPSKVIGNVTTPSIKIDDGAIFDGSCKMKDLQKEQKKEERVTGLFSRKKEDEVPEEKREEKREETKE